MNNVEKLYYKMRELNDDYADTKETKEAQDAVEKVLETYLSGEAYFECEEAINACMSANEKQGFVCGFQYAVSLLISGKAVSV